MKRALLAALAATTLLAVPVWAKDAGNDGGFRAYTSGEVARIASDKGYLLARLDTSKFKASYLIMRIPSDAELAAYDEARRAAYEKSKKKVPIEAFEFTYEGVPNLFEIRPRKPFGTEGEVALTLAELPPGEYVLYGESYSGHLYECLCFGTVGFTVVPGQVTDIGTLLIDQAAKKSDIPELASMSGLGRIARMDYMLFAIGLRPAEAGKAAAGIDPAKIVPARLRAIGPFVETNTVLATRLAPVEGVLAYDGARVIDVASGEEALPN